MAHHYDFAKWSNKTLGPRPTLEQQNTVHAFGKPGKQSLGLAMALRDAGVTAAQIKLAVEAVYGVGKPQNNHRAEMIRQGFFERVHVPALPGTNHTVYKIKLTPKGEARVKLGAYLAKPAAEKPVKAAKPAKVKKAKVAKAEKAAEAAAPVMGATDQQIEAASGPVVG